MVISSLPQSDTFSTIFLFVLFHGILLCIYFVDFVGRHLLHFELILKCQIGLLLFVRKWSVSFETNKMSSRQQSLLFRSVSTPSFIQYLNCYTQLRDTILNVLAPDQQQFPVSGFKRRRIIYTTISCMHHRDFVFILLFLFFKFVSFLPI